jgi:hypothetical protein
LPPYAAALLRLRRIDSTSTSPCTATTRLQLHTLYVNLAVHREYSSPAARALCQPHRAPRLLVSGCTRSTSTLLCTATTRHPASHALRQPRHAPRVLVSTLPAAAIYIDHFTSAARPDASARRAAHHAVRRAAHRAARRRLLHLRRASGCLGTSRGSSCGTSRGSSRGSSRRSSSTTPPRAGSSSTTPPLVRVPRHVARLVTRLVMPLIVDYTARPGASARRAARRRLLRVAQSRRRLLRAP